MRDLKPQSHAGNRVARDQLHRRSTNSCRHRTSGRAALAFTADSRHQFTFFKFPAETRPVRPAVRNSQSSESLEAHTLEQPRRGRPVLIECRYRLPDATPTYRCKSTVAAVALDPGRAALRLFHNTAITSSQVRITKIALRTAARRTLPYVEFESVLAGASTAKLWSRPRSTCCAAIYAAPRPPRQRLALALPRHVEWLAALTSTISISTPFTARRSGATFELLGLTCSGLARRAKGRRRRGRRRRLAEAQRP